LVLLDKLIVASTSKTISGKKAFELFDTYGFPKDLTALILSEKGLSFNEEEFNTALEQQKNRSRSAAATSTEDWVFIKNTDTKEFVGYDSLKADVQIVQYRKVTVISPLTKVVDNKTGFCHSINLTGLTANIFILAYLIISVIRLTN